MKVYGIERTDYSFGDVYTKIEPTLYTDRQKAQNEVDARNAKANEHALHAKKCAQCDANFDWDDALDHGVSKEEYEKSNGDCCDMTAWDIERYVHCKNHANDFGKEVFVMVEFEIDGNISGCLRGDHEYKTIIGLGNNISNIEHIDWCSNCGCICTVHHDKSATMRCPKSLKKNTNKERDDKI